MLNKSLLSLSLIGILGLILVPDCFGQNLSDEDYFELSLQELAGMSVISGISRKEQSNFHQLLPAM